MPATKFHGTYKKYKKIVSIDAWKVYHKQYPNGVDYWTFRKILSDIGKAIMEEVFNRPLGFELPFRFGVLRMIGFKYDKMTIRKKLSKISFVRTNNYVYRLIWLKHKNIIKVRNAHTYVFKTGILVRKEIYSRIKNDEFFNWIKLDNSEQIKQMTHY